MSDEPTTLDRIGPVYLYMGSPTGPFVLSPAKHLVEDWNTETPLLILIHTGTVPYVVLEQNPKGPIHPVDAPAYVLGDDRSPLAVEIPALREFGLFVISSWLKTLPPDTDPNLPLKLHLMGIRHHDGGRLTVLSHWKKDLEPQDGKTGTTQPPSCTT